MAVSKKQLVVVGGFSLAVVAAISGAYAQILDPLNDDASTNSGEKSLILPGRIQNEQWQPIARPEKPKVLHSVAPAPHWFNEPPVYETNIPAGAAFQAALTSPVIGSKLRPGDMIEFETLNPITSGDGRWTLKEGSLVHAQVSLLSPMLTNQRKGRLGLAFYEIITPEGMRVSFTGDLLAYPGLNKTSKYKQAKLDAMLNQKMMVSQEGVLIVPLKGKASKEVFPSEKLFTVRIDRPIYYGATLALQDRKEDVDVAADKNIVPVRHFSSSAQRALNDTQTDDSMMVIPLDRFTGEEPMP